ncbi:MAG: hypothetical protein R3A10_05120 [Caldilineaceae bacterium]
MFIFLLLAERIERTGQKNEPACGVGAAVVDITAGHADLDFSVMHGRS